MQGKEEWRHEWQSPPPIGSKVILDGQAFVVQYTEAYVRKDGTSSIIIHYRGHCADCGEAFEITSGWVARAFARRCQEHRVPLKRVAGHRGDRVKVEVEAP